MSPVENPFWYNDNELGKPYRPDSLSASFTKAQSGADLPAISFHGLRHSSATILLTADVPVHVVSSRLGHASVSITADVYAHVLKDQATDAAERIGGALYRAGSGS
jgi:integrase